jgi:hypothetical protein
VKVANTGSGASGDGDACNNPDATANQGLAATKMNPEQRMLSGFLQVVASAFRLLYPGGRGVGGWGAARIEPTKSKLRYEISPPKYRSVVLTLVKARSMLTAPSARCQRSRSVIAALSPQQLP